jgi:hypothetical protein
LNEVEQRFFELLFCVPSRQVYQVRMVYQVNKVYQVYKVCKVYQVRKVYKVCQVYKVHKVYQVDYKYHYSISTLILTHLNPISLDGDFHTS